MRINVSGLILIAGGIYALLAVHRIVPVSKNAESNEMWVRKFGAAMKVISPIVILFGLGEMFGLFR